MKEQIGFGGSVRARRGRRPREGSGRVRVGGVFELQALAPLRVARPGRLLDEASRVGLPRWHADALAFHVRQRGVLAVSHADLLGAAGVRVDDLVSGGGELLWERRAHNIVTNAGLDEILDKFWKGSGYTAAHYLGLTDGTPTVAAGDTMSSHAGWSEVTGYSESTRQALTLGSVSSQSISNSGSKAVITASGTITVGGAFSTTSSTKGGTTGVLVSVAAFSGGDESLSASETLTITYTFSAADDGV